MPLAGDGVGDTEAEAAVRETQDLVRGGRVAVAPGVGDDHDLELEPLGCVDGQEPNRVGALLLGDRVALGRADRFLLLDEADEPFDVRAAQLLVGACEARELAEVGVAAPAVPLGEHGQVVVVVGDDPLAEPLQREAAGRVGEPVVALPERPQQARVRRVEIRGQRALQPGEDRAARRAPDEHQRVVGDADERRGEDADQGFVVVAVLEQAQVREEVDDLLLAEVATPGRAVGGETRFAQLLLVPLGIGAGGEEEDDLARVRGAGVDELLDPPRHMPGLRAAPVHAGPRVRRLVGHEQLDRRAEDRVREVARGGEGLELLAELGAEEMVDHGEQLGPRAVVARERQQRLGLRTALAEDPHVGMAEAVDRLELVADEEPLRVGAGEEIHDLTLEPVRVLELVDHDRPEAELLALPQRCVVAEEVARAQLQVLEVERRLAVLGRGVRVRESEQQLLQQLPVLQREGVERRLLDGLAGFLEAGATLRAHTQPAEIEQALGQRRRDRQLHRLYGRRPRRVGRLGVLGQAARRLGELRETLLEAGTLAQLEQRARVRPNEGSRRRSSASGAGRRRRRSRAAAAAPDRRRRRSRSAPPRTPRCG